MSELIQKIREWIAVRSQTTRAFYARNKTLMLSGLTVLSILLIVWARLGFTFQFSQFFAASPPSNICEQVAGGTCQGSCSAGQVNINAPCNSGICCKQAVTTPVSTTPPPTNAPTGGFSGFCTYDPSRNPGVDDRNRPECACAGANRTNQCHVCTQSWKEGNTDYSTGQWQNWDNSGLCRPTCPAELPYETQRDIQGGGRFPFPQYCVEKPADCPDGYHAFGSNPTVCARNVVATPVPTATRTATPPVTTTIGPTPMCTPPICAAPPAGCSYQGAGQCACGTLVCPTVTATATAIPTATAVPTSIVNPADITLAVTGHNATVASAEGSFVSAINGQQVEVISLITNPRSSGITLSATVRAVLPTGLIYVPGSTTINGAPAPSDGVVTSGLVIGSLSPLQSMRVVFRARVNGPSFPVGQSQATVTVQANGTDTPIRTGQMIVVITQTAGQVGVVKTGPEDAVILAFLVSGIMTLLYISYTHTSLFRRREVEAITSSPDPLDFKG